MKTRYEYAYVLNVMADDRPGIVAAVSDAVSGLGGSIDACSQTVLCGYFTLIMVVSVDEPVEPDELACRVRPGGSAQAGLQVMVRPFAPPGEAAEKEAVDCFVITAFGEDKPDIVRRFSQYLASKDINIVDLYGARKGGEFVLISEVEVPRHWNISMLQGDLEEMGKDQGFTVRLQHENVFVATNQLRLTR